MNRLIRLPFLCVLLVLSLARVASAADALYQNDGIVSYPGTENFPPVIDATNFVNSGSFTINFTTFSATQPFYETSDTINYTNIGSMAANTGFNFDNQSTSTGLRTMSGSFYNPGTVSCGSTNNTGDVFAGQLFFFVDGLPQCLVNATNIVNSGTVDVGLDGLMRFTGQNVDLSRSTLLEEGASANAFGSGDFGLNTNFWDPSAFLGPNFAESAFFYVPPFILELTNSTAYFNQQGLGTSNVITRAVFIQDTSGSNVSYNVYFNTAGIGFGNGSVTIEWVGSYQDAASGNFFNNYLYLNDDYALGATTNVALINGYPDNFTFTESSTQLPIGVVPAPPGFLNVFPSGTLTNRYAFANVQLTSTTVSTNSIQDANHSITNLPGRIQISAANELNLDLAQITGPNYLSVQSTNQFDGSGGALIQSPYSDLNLGVTNGFLTVSNLLSPQIPNWGGNVQAWSTRWLTVDATGVTNDFRVLIVGSQLTPTTLAQVQDLILHGTNSIVISDALNITRTFTADAQNFTVTTNGPGNGATSVDGELNVESANIFWGTSLPNLRNLTNNGAIRFQNLAQFISSPTVVTVTTGTPAVAATGTLSQSGLANVANNDEVTIGSTQYAFVNVLHNATANQVKIDTTFDGSISNFIAAINHAAGSGSKYSSATTTNTQVTAGSLTNHAFTVTAIAGGTTGNSIATTETSAHLTWNHGTLTGGIDSIPGTTNVSTVQVPYEAFINNGLLSDQGSIIFANYFQNSGTISNGINSFILQSQTTVLTNGLITAGGDVTNITDSLVVSNLMLQAGRSLTLQVTNLLTDTGPSPTNGNFWSVGGASSFGLNLPRKPVVGDLLGTTITNIAPINKNVINIWAATNSGTSVAGYTNNAAIGRLYLDARGTSSKFTFNGIGTNNALYVDYLELDDYATNRDANGNPTALTNNSGMVIYYAQAVQNGVSVADKLNHKNSDHLRWVSAYNGYFSSTNLVFGGTTNAVNAALAQSTIIDSDGDGIPNASDSSPIFVSGEVNFILTLTNVPPLKAQLQWATIPGATNYVFYNTNLVSANWLLLTNFTSAGTVPPVGGWPITAIVTDPVNPVQPRYYRVRVDPNSILANGP
ncbi:MAG TPA: hypothetical protein VHY30_08725 [Verrucomicrobiae bacterium]|nr:hypothetical protein [Verrucomicrobiae bacterium]